MLALVILSLSVDRFSVSSMLEFFLAPVVKISNLSLDGFFFYRRNGTTLVLTGWTLSYKCHGVADHPVTMRRGPIPDTGCFNKFSKSIASQK